MSTSEQWRVYLEDQSEKTVSVGFAESLIRDIEERDKRIVRLEATLAYQPVELVDILGRYVEYLGFGNTSAYDDAKHWLISEGILPEETQPVTEASVGPLRDKPINMVDYAKQVCGIGERHGN